MQVFTALRERERYKGLQSSILPVTGKAVYFEGWTHVPVDNLWSQTQAWQDINIGLKPEKLQVIDADSLDAAYDCTAFLESIGIYDCPQESTNHGVHYFIKVNGHPGKKENLSIKGEFYSGTDCQVVISPSEINGKTRKLEFCTPESLLDLAPVLEYSDLRPILPVSAFQPTITAAFGGLLPVIVDQRKQPNDWILAGLVECAKVPKGSSITIGKHFFLTRSHLEAFAVAYLMLKGFGYTETRDIFEGIKPGHWYEATSNGHDWLLETWKRCLVLGCRPDLENLYNKLPDVTNADRVFKALIRVAWQFCKTKAFGVSCAVLADYLRVDTKTIFNCLNKLESSGLIAINRGYSDKRADHVSSYKQHGRRKTNEFDLICDIKGSLDFDDVLGKLTDTAA